jgi:hypothetical protein
MPRACRIAAARYAELLPAFDSFAEAEVALHAFRDDRLAVLTRLAQTSSEFQPDYRPASLKNLEQWYFVLVDSEGFTQLGVSAEVFEECIAMYFLEIAVRHTDVAVQEYAFGPGLYQVGVRRHGFMMLGNRRRPRRIDQNNKRKQSMWHEYQRFLRPTEHLADVRSRRQRRLMRLSHLSLTIFLSCVLALPLAWILGQVGVSLTLERRGWVIIVPAMLVAIGVAEPIARRLGIPPLMIFSGPCPGCRKRPPGWWQEGSDADRMHLVCGQCGERVALWVTSRPTDVESSDMPTYVLRQPTFLGLWRRVGQDTRTSRD